MHPQEQFSRDLEQFSNKRFIMEYSYSDLWDIFVHLQLALSHPQANGPASAHARQLALEIQDLIAISPATRYVAWLGWRDRSEPL